MELSKLVSQKFVERNLVLPLALDQETQQLEVAMAEPYDLKVLDTLKTLVGHRKYELKPILSAPDNIKEGINYSYNFQEVFEDEVDIEWLAEETDDRKDLVSTEDIPQIRRIINQVLYRAVVENASDVHIENHQNQVRVRFSTRWTASGTKDFDHQRQHSKCLFGVQGRLRFGHHRKPPFAGRRLQDADRSRAFCRLPHQPPRH